MALKFTLDIDEAILQTLGPRRLVNLLRNVKELPIPSSRSFQGLNSSAAIKFVTVMLGIGLVGHAQPPDTSALAWLVPGHRRAFLSLNSASQLAIPLAVIR